MSPKSSMGLVIRDVILLVHGLDGSATDFKVIENALSARLPDSLILNSNCNQGKTYDGIEAGSSRLLSVLLENTEHLRIPARLSVIVSFSNNIRAIV